MQSIHLSVQSAVGISWRKKHHHKHEFPGKAPQSNSQEKVNQSEFLYFLSQQFCSQFLVISIYNTLILCAAMYPLSLHQCCLRVLYSWAFFPVLYKFSHKSSLSKSSQALYALHIWNMGITRYHNDHKDSLSETEGTLKIGPPVKSYEPKYTAVKVLAYIFLGSKLLKPLAKFYNSFIFLKRTLQWSFWYLITLIFASFSFGICGLTIAEILSLLHNNQRQGAVDVNLFAPDEEEMTDEDSDEEDDAIPKDINHLDRGILTQQGEFIMNNDNKELFDFTVVRKFLKYLICTL